MGSKENSITLPAMLLLVEGIFFRSLARVTWRHLLASVGIFVLAGAAIYLLTNGNLIGSIFNYDHRSFTLWQRLLTESRIVVLYLSLLFFPAPWRLSLDHDIVVSTSLVDPPTTLLSILFLSGLTVWGFWKHKSLPIPAFAVLFFLLNHTIESTIFPLELIFEHRNYLPSLFLFFPVAIMLVDAYHRDSLRTTPIAQYVVTGGTGLVLCILAFATFTRNAAWQTEQSLWEDSLAKAPGQSRPYINLAHTYQKLGRNDEAFDLCRQSLTKDSPTPAKDRMRAYNNMGNITMDRDAFAEATVYYRQALEAFSNEPSRYFLHKALVASGQSEEAEKELATLIENHPNDNELMTSMALVLAKQQNYPRAIATLRTVLNTAKNNSYEQSSALLCLGSLLSRQDDYQGAEKRFREALSITEPLLPLLCVISNHLRQGNQAAAAAQLRELQKHFSPENLISPVLSANRQNLLFAVEPSELATFIRNNPVSSVLPDNSKTL
jgi:tetratricopeptide (TPR) repeat protein